MMKIWEHALQRKFHLCIPFLGIARPQSQFPHSCVCERVICSQDRSTYFLQQNGQIDCGNISIAHRHMNVEIGTVLWPSYSLSGNICFQFSVLVLCSVDQRCLDCPWNWLQPTSFAIFNRQSHIKGRRKLRKGEKRGVAIMAVLADGDVGWG